MVVLIEHNNKNSVYFLMRIDGAADNNDKNLEIRQRKNK